MIFKINKVNWLTFLWLVIAFCILYFYRKSCSLNHVFYSDVVVTSMNLACLIICFYLINKTLIPRFLYNDKKGLFFLLLLLLIVVFTNLILLFQWAWYSVTETYGWEHAMELVMNFYYQLFDCYIVMIVGCLFSIAFKLMVDQLLSQSQYANLQKENAQTELSFLKAQINPHFLFNSINSIFAHIDKKNIDARNMVLKFSDMLRYQLYECNIDKISFEKEFSYMNNFIELQRLRKEENLAVTIETKGEMQGFEIAPLLLIPFIENAFKYVSNHEDKKNILKIKLIKDLNFFCFYCMNTKDKIVSRSISKEKGIGINNVKRRLELIYPNKYDLKITDNELTYEVNLKIEMS